MSAQTKHHALSKAATQQHQKQSTTRSRQCPLGLKYGTTAHMAGDPPDNQSHLYLHWSSVSTLQPPAPQRMNESQPNKANRGTRRGATLKQNRAHDRGPTLQFFPVKLGTQPMLGCKHMRYLRLLPPACHAKAQSPSR